jgi:Family of unknown function (DUF5694)
MKTQLLLFSFLCITLLGAAQHDRFDPDKILVGDRALPHVMLLGTFHFAYPGMDAHVTEEKDRVNVLTDQRQAELKELLDVIMRFKPTKLCVETQGAWLWHEYQDYKSGKPLGANEFYQLGFRIMDRVPLDTLYAVDAAPMVMDLRYGDDSLHYAPWIDSLYTGWDWGGPDPASKLYDSLYKAHDAYEVRHTMLQNFLSMNDQHTLNRDFGAYLNGGFLMEGYAGADVLSIHWYNRNLRIFRNIKRITTSPQDRILVIFGAGHMGVLKHLFDCDPMYRVVELKELVER